MSNTNSLPTNASRRKFLLKGSLATLGILTAPPSVWSRPVAFLFGQKPDSKVRGVQIAMTTYSYRSMPCTPQKLVQYCIDSNINAVELKGDEIEDFAGKPANPVKMPPRVDGKQPPLTDELKAQIAAYQKQVADWRTSVSMDKFKEVRKMFEDAGLTIFAYKPNALNANNTDGEVEYAMRAAKALGATSVSVELPKEGSETKRLGDLGTKNKVYIGYHAHLQATDTAWDEALQQSPYNTMNLDCGHYIAAGGKNTKEALLALIEAKHDRISSLHIKDRKNKENGGENQVWGQGDTPIKEILTLLRDKKYAFPATIELEYKLPADSDAVKETKRCFEYAKGLLL
jgi:sugar phosphate isomerase/epimerase